MFATVRAWQSLTLTSLETMVTPPWDGEFTVNYNLDNEQTFDQDPNSMTYGNYMNHWSTAFDVDSSNG